MAIKRQAGQTGSTRRLASLLAWGSLGLAGSFLTGCSSTPQTAAQPHDPLHGVMVPPGALPQPTNTPKSATNSVTPTYNAGGVAALPTSLSSSNLATLAGANSNSPLGRPLAIDDGNSTGPPFFPARMTDGIKTQQVPGSSLPPPNPNPKVELVPDLKSVTPTVLPTTSWQSPQSNDAARAVPSSKEDVLEKRLQERGVLNQKQDVVPEGVLLTCYVSRGPEGGVRILEATAADYATAAEAILQKLNK